MNAADGAITGRRSLPLRSRLRVIRLALSVVAVSACLGGPAAAKKKPPAQPAPAANATTDTSEVLFRIGTQALTRADVQRRFEELPEGVRSNFTTPEGRQQLLDRMVEERVWLLAAEKNGVPDRPKVQQQLLQQRRDFIIRTYLTEMMATNPAPGDSELRAYYDAHVAEYKIPASVTVRHIQTRTRLAATQVLGLARAKQDWNKLSMRFSTDSLSRGSGGNLGSVTRDGQFAIIGHQPALADSAFALGAGRIGGPYRTDRGWHVLKVEDATPEGVRPFEQMRGVLLRQMSAQRSQDYYKGKLDEMRKSLGVAPDSAAIKRFVSQQKGAREMFKDAQEKATAEERIAAYRRLLAAYPDSDVSAQAAFMVGFTYSEELKNYDEAEKDFRMVLARYPDSELAASAKWMVEHMRNEEAPAFIHSAADSMRPAPQPANAARAPASKP